jgi:hypothetical protein
MTRYSQCSTLGIVISRSGGWGVTQLTLRNQIRHIRHIDVSAQTAIVPDGIGNATLMSLSKGLKTSGPRTISA